MYEIYLARVINFNTLQKTNKKVNHSLDKKVQIVIKGLHDYNNYSSSVNLMTPYVKE